MGDTVYKIGEVASMLATSIRTIRYYEEEFLLKPIRTDRGTRLYSDAHVERLKAILRLARIGFSIESIRAISSTREKCSTGNESSQKIAQLFDKTLSDLDKQIQVLDSLKNEIRSAKRIIRSCNGCKNHPSSKGCPDCPVRLHLNEVTLLNLVWDTEQ